MKVMVKAEFQSIFAGALRNYRKRNKISQSRMARLLGMTDRSYVDLEHGRFCPSSLTLLAYLRALPKEERNEFLDCILLS